MLCFLSVAILYKRTGWIVRVMPRAGYMSPWGTRQPTAESGLRGIGIRCPLFELQIIKQKDAQP